MTAWDHYRACEREWLSEVRWIKGHRRVRRKVARDKNRACNARWRCQTLVDWQHRRLRLRFDFLIICYWLIDWLIRNQPRSGFLWHARFSGRTCRYSLRGGTAQALNANDWRRDWRGAIGQQSAPMIFDERRMINASERRIQAAQALYQSSPSLIYVDDHFT